MYENEFYQASVEASPYFKKYGLMALGTFAFVAGSAVESGAVLLKDAGWVAKEVGWIVYNTMKEVEL